jgi:GNAT superfamily N-acetyltransferase
MKIEIQNINTRAEKLKFVKSQWKFYENNPNFVPPLIMDRMKLIDTQKNPFYKHADIALFLAYRNNEIVGRIGAITNDLHNKTHNDNIGFFGFFECIDDQEVADNLFNEAVKWLKSKGKDGVRGPVNPSMNDEVALLVDGFDDPPRVLMPYNPKYYEKLILNAGFEKAKDLFAYRLHKDKFKTDKMVRLHKIIREKYNLTIKDVDFKNKEQFLKDIEVIKQVYNKAWEPNWGFVKITDEEFDYMAADLKMIANPRLAYIAYVGDEPVGFHLGLPDINQMLIYNKKGSTLGALWHMFTKKKKMDFMRIVILGVLPQYQGKGIDAVMYFESGTRADEIGLTYGEASWILEDNEKMRRAAEVTMNGEIYKTYRLFEKAI